MNIFQYLAYYLFKFDYVSLKLELGNSRAYRVKKAYKDKQYIMFGDEVVFLDEIPDWILEVIPLTHKMKYDWNKGLKELKKCGPLDKG